MWSRVIRFCSARVSTPETARSWYIVDQLLLNLMPNHCQVKSVRFSVFSKEPIQESKWVPSLVCVNVMQSPQNPCSLSSDSDALQRFIFCKLRCEREKWWTILCGSVCPDSDIQSFFIFMCLLYLELHGWKSIWPAPAVDDGSSFPNRRFSQGCEPFVQPVSTSLSQTQTNSNIFCHDWSHVW